MAPPVWYAQDGNFRPLTVGTWIITSQQWAVRGRWCGPTRQWAFQMANSAPLKKSSHSGPFGSKTWFMRCQGLRKGLLTSWWTIQRGSRDANVSEKVAWTTVDHPISHDSISSGANTLLPSNVDLHCSDVAPKLSREPSRISEFLTSTNTYTESLYITHAMAWLRWSLTWTVVRFVVSSVRFGQSAGVISTTQ